LTKNTGRFEKNDKSSKHELERIFAQMDKVLHAKTYTVVLTHKECGYLVDCLTNRQSESTFKPTPYERASLIEKLESAPEVEK